MKEQQDYTQDIAEIRSMMERSSKFLSLSGWSGILAGLYALSGSFIAYTVLHFNPDDIVYSSGNSGSDLPKVMWLAAVVLILAVGTAIFLSYRKAVRKGESFWNAASRRLVVNFSVPLAAGGILIVILLSRDMIGLSAPLTLIFYGLALFNAGKFTYDELKFLGMIQMGLGLIGSYVIEYSLLLWALGFGAAHIAYGLYIHFKYER